MSSMTPEVSTVAHKRRKISVGANLSDNALKNWFVYPTIIFLIVFNVFPLVYSLGYSFTDYRASVSAEAKFIGLQNYRELLGDEGVWHSFKLTAYYTLISVGGQLLLGFGAALLLNREFPLKGLVTTLMMLPMMMSMAIVGLFWKLLYNPSWGIINYLIGADGLVWLSNPELALLAVAITDIWMWYPFVMLLCLAGLSAIPQSLYEAAAIDRASSWFVFRNITLPLVSPLLLIAVIFRTMEAFKTFDLAFVMTSMAETELVSIRLFKMAFQEWQTGRSSALAYIMLVGVLIITTLYIRYLNKLKER
ncbi:sugar ABC transporter permease [Parasalinivibrio latis]|uniref:carbohydrate ABC transporter permease n=1 Tax=Parasalinivibrio latis TaxID=2952610 RepID=UPI0030E0292E